MDDKKFCQEYFFAIGLSLKEFDELLVTGWRRFGYYFFRPQCGTCFECIPVRVKVNDFHPTHSQKRVLRKNINTKVLFNDINYRDEIFEIYQEHSRDRFNQESDKEDFIRTFFISAVPAIQAEYYVDDELAAVGFIDISTEGLSSVYFIYRTRFNRYSLGIFGALKEIEYAKNLGLPYYYLGYYVQGNAKMLYKNRFKPFEIYDWHQKIWLPASDHLISCYD